MTQTVENADELLGYFVDNLLFEKKLPVEDPDILAEIRRDLLERVEVFLNAGLLAAIPESESERLDKLLAGDNAEATQSFMRQHIPNMQQKVTDLLLDFKAAYLNS